MKNLDPYCVETIRIVTSNNDMPDLAKEHRAIKEHVQRVTRLQAMTGLAWCGCETNQSGAN